MPDPGTPTPKVVVTAAPGADWRRLHLWQIQPVRDLLLIALVWGILWLGHRLSIVTVPILLALLLAYLFEPVVRRLTRVRWISRPVAALIIIVGLGTLVVVPLFIGGAVAIVQGAAVARDVATNTAKMVALVQKDELLITEDWEGELRASKEFKELGSNAWRALVVWIANKRRDLLQAQAGEKEIPPYERDLYEAIQNGLQWVQANADTVAKSVGQRAIASGADALRAVLRLFKSLGLFLFSAFLTAFFFFFFSTGHGKVLAFWQSLIPERRKGRVIELAVKMDKVISGFIRGRLTICFLMSIYYTIGYAIVGVPAPLIVGPLVAIMSLVPYLALLGVPLSIILLALDSGSGASWYWIVLGPLAVYMIGQGLDDYILSPVIQGKSTDLDTPSILVATIAGGALAGFYGVLLAIPVAACIKIVLKEVFWPRFQAWAAGKASDPLPISTRSPPPAAERE